MCDLDNKTACHKITTIVQKDKQQSTMYILFPCAAPLWRTTLVSLGSFSLYVVISWSCAGVHTFTSPVNFSAETQSQMGGL